MCGNYNKHGAKKCTDHLVREVDLKIAILEDVRMFVSNLSNDIIYKRLETQLRKIDQQNEKQITTIDGNIEKLKTRKKKLVIKI